MRLHILVFSLFFAHLEQKLTEMLTDGNDIIATPTQENDNQLVEMMTTVEPMIVSEPTAEAAEDSGIQTANESPPSEGHSDSVEVIQSDDSAKNGKLRSN